MTVKLRLDLQNESKRFKVFVANRVQIITEHSDVGQWQYVASKGAMCRIRSSHTTASDCS